MKNKAQWRGLAALVVDAVTHGSVAVERLQKETVGRPLALLEKVPPIAPLSRLVHTVYDASVTGTHEAVRFVARTVGGAVDLALDLAEPTADDQKPGGRPPPGPPPPP